MKLSIPIPRLNFFKKKKKMISPITDKIKISSPFGERINPITKAKQFHNGVDLPIPVNTPLVAPDNGVVHKIYVNDIGGLQLVIYTNKGYHIGYAHLNAVKVKEGEAVAKGQLVALSGNTGRSTGPHLHFTVMSLKNKEYVNPENYIKFA